MNALLTTLTDALTESLPYYLSSRDHFTEWLTRTGDDDACDPADVYLPGPTGTLAAFIVVHEIDRAYGGPEEGGWWYDVGTAKLSVVVTSYAEAITEYLRLSRMYQPKCRRCGLNATEHHDDGSGDGCDHYARPDVGSVAYDGGVYKVSLSRRPAADYPQDRPRWE